MLATSMNGNCSPADELLEVQAAAAVFKQAVYTAGVL